MKHIYLLIIFILLGEIALAQNKKVIGTVKGSIISNNSSKGISGAYVSIFGTNTSTLSDSLGNFVLETTNIGYQRLYVFAEGYDQFVSESFLVSGSVDANIVAKLNRLSLTVKEITVVAAPLKNSVVSPVSVRRIGIEEIDLTPGANRDISKVVQLSAGVVPVSFGNRNDVLVRGGGANENKYSIDGIEIPVLNHFAVQGSSGGYASLVNTELLSGVEFYTGAFPAQYANGLSSILDMTAKVGNSDKFHAKAIVGFTDFGINIDTPISKNGKTTLIGSYRISYLSMLFSLIKLPFLPSYNDYQFKINSKLSDRDELYFIGLGSVDKNRLNLGLDSLDDSQRYIQGYLPNNNQTSYVFGAGYKHKFRGGEFSSIISHNYLNNKLYKFFENDQTKDLTMDIKSRELEVKIRSEVKFNNLGGFVFKVGIGAGYGALRSDIYQKQYISDKEILVDFSNNLNLWRYSIYSTLSRDIVKNKLYAAFSLRADGMDYSSNTSNLFKQLSPRFSLMYNFVPKWNLSASVGRYYQEPSYTTMAYDTPNQIESQRDRLKYMAVNNYVLGLDYSPNTNSKFKIEGFFKDYSNMPVSLIDSLPISTANFEQSIVGAVPAKSVGKGRAYGMEFTYRNLDLKNTIINFSYSLIYSEVNKMDENLNPIKGRFVPSAWDVRNIVNVSAIHKFGRNWTLGAKWYLVGGMPYTPYNKELSSLITAWDAQNRPYINTKEYNTLRSETYHQLDIRIDKVWYFDKWRLGFYIDIQNAYNSQANKQELYLPEVDKNGNNVIDPTRPEHYKMKSVESSFGGTILPTIGITIEF